jgi:hypothetical protein
MTCPSGFDPFGERDERLLAHARGCPACGDVLRVLEASRATWRRGLAQDEARAVFRERRIGRALPPGRKAMTGAVVAVVLAGMSGFALARLGAPKAPRLDAPPPASASAAPPIAPPPAPSPTWVRPPESARAPEPDVRAHDAPSDRPEARAPRPHEDSREVWRRAMALLEAGDRAGAEAAFRTIMEMRVTEPGLRSRATFRWAQLLLARGDTRAPREALFRLVRGKDAVLGMDAALLLERGAPVERQQIWDAYLEATTDPTLRARAIRHRDGRAMTPSGSRHDE